MVEVTDTAYCLSWPSVAGHSPSERMVYTVYASTTFPVDTDKASNIIAIGWQNTAMAVKRREDNAPLYFAVTAVDRYGQESADRQEDF